MFESHQLPLHFRPHNPNPSSAMRELSCQKAFIAISIRRSSLHNAGHQHKTSNHIYSGLCSEQLFAERQTGAHLIYSWSQLAAASSLGRLRASRGVSIDDCAARPARRAQSRRTPPPHNCRTTDAVKDAECVKHAAGNQLVRSQLATPQAVSQLVKGGSLHRWRCK